MVTGFDGGGTDFASREINWFIKWLASDPIYTPQPYHYLADVLRSMGHAKSANAILYAGKERERNEATGLNWWGLSLLKWIIGYGYGYRYFCVVPWVAVITLFGAWVFSTTPPGTSKNLLELFGFSFDPQMGSGL